MTSVLTNETYPLQEPLLNFEESLARYGSEMDDSVIDEARQLIEQGARVEVIAVSDPCPDDERRAKAQEWIDATKDMEPQAAHELMYSLDALGHWRKRSLGTGMGIFPLYNARYAKTLGEGINSKIFHEKLFSQENGEVLSAVEVLALKNGTEKAQKSLEQHEDVIVYPIDEESRIIFSGSEDAVGVRVRSQLAKEMALKAVEDHDKTKPLVLASLGAGSAIPAIETMLYLEEQGYEIGAYHFVDEDPMALATALSLVRSREIDESKIKLHVEKILTSEVTSIEVESVDIVDAWGLAEYFPGKLAVNLTAAAHKLLADNGTYIYGNMLTERLQKDYFNNVVQWRPKVRTRSLAEGLKVLADAGLTDTEAVIPTSNGVYVGYAGRKSPEGLAQHVGSQRKRGKAVVELVAVQ